MTLSLAAQPRQRELTSERNSLENRNAVATSLCRGARAELLLRHGDTAPWLQRLHIDEIAFYAPMRRNMKVVSGFTTSPFISSRG